MFKITTIIILNLVIIASFFFDGEAFMHEFNKTSCKSFDCDYIVCPDGESIKTPTGEIVQCEHLDLYIEANDL